MKIKKAMIFAAGFGKRLLPLTLKTPKPLLELNNKTLLENCILFLEDCGIKEIIINVHYLAEQIIEFIDKKKFKSKIYISHEKEKILGTGGGLNYANQKFKNFFKDSFITINPDTLWNIQYINAYKIMEEFHYKEKKAQFILLLVSKNNCFDENLKGDFSLKNSKQNELIRGIGHLEKKDINEFTYTGLQIVRSNYPTKIFKKSKPKIYSLNHYWNTTNYQDFCKYGYFGGQKFYHVSNLETFQKLKKIKLSLY